MAKGELLYYVALLLYLVCGFNNLACSLLLLLTEMYLGMSKWLQRVEAPSEILLFIIVAVKFICLITTVLLI